MTIVIFAVMSATIIQAGNFFVIRKLGARGEAWRALRHPVVVIGEMRRRAGPRTDPRLPGAVIGVLVAYVACFLLVVVGLIVALAK